VARRQRNMQTGPTADVVSACEPDMTSNCVEDAQRSKRLAQVRTRVPHRVDQAADHILPSEGDASVSFLLVSTRKCKVFTAGLICVTGIGICFGATPLTDVRSSMDFINSARLPRHSRFGCESIPEEKRCMTAVCGLMIGSNIPLKLGFVPAAVSK
jgi:hypothetical protein